MNIITALVAVLAATSVYRLWITARTQSKVAHFKGKLVGTQKMIWDLEFKRFKTMDIREGIRKEYDFMLSRVASIEEAIKNFKGKKEDKATLEDQLTLATNDADRLKRQIENIDAEIHGAKPSQTRPEGVLGITEQIDSYRELRAMLAEWVKGGCK